MHDIVANHKEDFYDDHDLTTGRVTVSSLYHPDAYYLAGSTLARHTTRTYPYLDIAALQRDAGSTSANDAPCQ